MKKCMLLALLLLCVLAMCACAKENNGEDTNTPTRGEEQVTPTLPMQETKYEGDLPGLIEKIYEKAPTNLNLVTTQTDINDKEMLAYNTGLSGGENLAEVYVSESAFGAQAYSLVLVRVKDGVDTKGVADAMKESINTRKWICVGADDVSTATYGDIAMYVMTSTTFENSVTAKALTDAFRSVCEGK